MIATISEIFCCSLCPNLSLFLLGLPTAPLAFPQSHFSTKLSFSFSTELSRHPVSSFSLFEFPCHTVLVCLTALAMFLLRPVARVTAQGPVSLPNVSQMTGTLGRDDLGIGTRGASCHLCHGNTVGSSECKSGCAIPGVAQIEKSFSGEYS